MTHSVRVFSIFHVVGEGQRKVVRKAHYWIKPLRKVKLLRPTFEIISFKTSFLQNEGCIKISWTESTFLVVFPFHVTQFQTHWVTPASELTSLRPTHMQTHAMTCPFLCLLSPSHCATFRTKENSAMRPIQIVPEPALTLHFQTVGCTCTLACLYILKLELLTILWVSGWRWSFLFSSPRPEPSV